MGNRAVIAFETGASQPCIYLHWNGGRASIEAFLKFAQETGIGKLPLESAVEMLARSIGLWMEVEVNKSTVYIEPYSRADKNNHDNGVYLVDRERMEITGRAHVPQRDHGVYCEELDSKKTNSIYTEMLAHKLTVLAMIAGLEEKPEAGSW